MKAISIAVRTITNGIAKVTARAPANSLPSVSISLKGAILVPVGLIGLLYLVLGSRVEAIMGTREKPTTAAYVIGIGAVLAGIGLYIWVRSTLQAHGYDFQGQI